MIEQVFERYANDVHRSPQLTANFVANLIAEIRPPKPHQVEAAVKAIQALCYLLNNDPQKTRLLREAILKLLSEHNPISLFVVARHSAFSGFFTEMRRRISHKFLPEAIDTSYLIDLFALFFTKSSDELWVLAVPDSVWEQLIIAIRFEDASTNVTEPCRQNLLEATQVLSYRIAALGLEPELLRNHPELEQHNSPFITQHTELAEFLASSGNKVCNATASPDVPASDFTGEDVADIKHILVMLDQCNNIISKIRRNSTQTGTSIQLTLLLQRMSQQISRLETLLNIIDHLNCGKTANVEVVQLFKALVYSECHKNDVHEHWQENMELMALRVTENASRTGEHYITENRSDYFALMRSAMGAGVIVGVMAMIKILFAKQHLAPLTEAILFSLNYGLGFILIHILHFTVATKQPAMTAAAIAASIDASDGKSRGMDNLVAMIACTMRSQMAAIFGNVVLAIPIAMLIAWGTYYFSGQHFVSPEKARHLLADIDPINSGALFYAAIAGVCLFLSGLIAGYHDNL
ncbi:MAG: preprotein translocase subunit TatB, partial [Methylotenera sp.]|nr:preprotein translocase subunit TatB [Methylotenera sp.]